MKLTKNINYFRSNAKEEQIMSEKQRELLEYDRK
jgi:hypothetical protein